MPLWLISWPWDGVQNKPKLTVNIWTCIVSNTDQFKIQIPIFTYCLQNEDNFCLGTNPILRSDNRLCITFMTISPDREWFCSNPAKEKHSSMLVAKLLKVFMYLYPHNSGLLVSCFIVCTGIEIEEVINWGSYASVSKSYWIKIQMESFCFHLKILTSKQIKQIITVAWKEGLNIWNDSCYSINPVFRRFSTVIFVVKDMKSLNKML